MKLSKQNSKLNTLTSGQIKHKAHHRRKIRKITSNIYEHTMDKMNSQLFNFEKFGDASTDKKSSTKKCTMDLSKIVSDHELEKMKSTILTSLGRIDLESPSKTK